WRRRQKSGSDAMFAACGNERVHRGKKTRVVKLSRNPHGHSEIVVSHPRNVHTGHRDDVVQILECLFCFKQKDDRYVFVCLRKEIRSPSAIKIVRNSKGYTSFAGRCVPEL